MAESKGSANGSESSFAKIEKVVSSSLRSLPTETGDGTYVKGSTMTGLAKDLGHFGLKDVETLAEVAKNAVTGDPVDDREYIMERVIQVCLSRLAFDGSKCSYFDSLPLDYLQLPEMARN